MQSDGSVCSELARQLRACFQVGPVDLLKVRSAAPEIADRAPLLGQGWLDRADADVLDEDREDVVDSRCRGRADRPDPQRVGDHAERLALAPVWSHHTCREMPT
jgi:hypothetical protein